MDNIQNKAKTLVELLKWRAENQPDKMAFTFLEDGETEAGSMTYKELETKAKSIAVILESAGLKGERALLIFNSSLEYVAALFGCMYAGVISVPLHPVGKNRSLSRISSIAKDSEAKISLSTKVIQNELKKDYDEDSVLKNIEWMNIDEIPDETAKDWKEKEIDENSLAYLQYTSGSTGHPKGVMVNHKNVMTNLRITDKSHPTNKDSVMVHWLPIFHDMGLIYGVFFPFFCGIPCYFMTPQDFVQSPYKWLKAISKYKGTHNASPNFAFEFCINKISEEQKKDLDLSSWTVAMNCAEPVRAETLERFVEYFGECGFKLKYFCPAYALAEGTLILSTTFKDDEPVIKRFSDFELEKNFKAVDVNDDMTESKRHVGHSHAIGDTRIAIVNPKTLVECKDGEVGEIWASGFSIAQGYWRKEDATKETFKAHIADTNEGPFLRTGDLGFTVDNELYITGRLKDLIIIRGQNYFPQDIEDTVHASHPALRLGCVGAFAMEVDGEEHLGIVQEIQQEYVDTFDVGEVVRSISKAVSEAHDLQVYSITLIQPLTVPKTSSGKIQRKDCRIAVAEGTLDVIAEWKRGKILDFRSMILDINKNKAGAEINKVNEDKFNLTTNNLKEWLVNRISEMLFIEKDSVDMNESFASYGMDSLRAVQLSGDLEVLLNKKLPNTLVYDYPTINLLSRHLNADENNSAGNLNKDNLNKLSKLTETETENEPIAIVGIGLRFPGANNVTEFWNNLINGKDSISPIPEGRWNKNLLNKSTVTLGGFVEDVDKFDPVFFGISPREAVQIDPQQRFALEVTWEALENANINPDSLAGKNVGVFIGIYNYDYARLTAGRKDLFDVYTGTGTSLGVAAGRISYIFDFRGPSIAIDTACSSSLVALHTACQSLKSGQSEIAIAGGVNLLLSPDWNVVFTEADMLAPDGRCKTFDADADGYVRSEGCGIVILKKLSDAIKDGDRIYSLIKGSAINQDGKSNGLTAPNGPSQEAVITSALKDADVKSNEINYLETHGTGTPLGDPIEVNSLAKVLSKDRAEDNLLYIGSVKTNIGHLEAAAGIAGVIKASLALYNKEIPKHLNYKKLNPQILIEGTPVKIADENIKWKSDTNNIRLAGVSSFGFGGTNAHVILQEAPVLKQSASTKTKPFNLLTLSAKSENALSELAERYENYLLNNPNAKPEDICYSANTGRASHNHRAGFVFNSADTLKKQLDNFKNNKTSTGVVSATVKINYFPKVAFLFPGQGAQYIGMGKELYDTHPLFRSIINQCDGILRNYLDKPLLEVLFYEKDENLNPINETTYTQPALFAIEYALAKLWMSWGIEPAVMMGHSAGEYVAACLAGVFSLEDGLKLVTERGRLMQTLTGEGEMYTIFSDETSVKKYLKGFEDFVSVASINGPLKTVISGDKNSLSKIIPKFDSDQIEYKKINVSIASHSPLMHSMIDEFRKVCNTVKYSSPLFPVVSNITGEVVTDRISNADYWCEHILSGVRFSDGIKACVNFGCEFFIDLGPKPTSISMGQETVANANIHWLQSIKYNFTIWETMLQSLGTLYVNGVNVSWENFYKEFAHKKITLPSYPFQSQRYWIEDAKTNETDSVFNFALQNDTSVNPLLGNKLLTASKNEFIFVSQISGNNPEYLQDHIVFDKIVLPGAAYIDIALSALGELTNTKSAVVSDVLLHQALFLENDSVKNIQTILRKENKREYTFQIFSPEDDGENRDWTLHASGLLNHDANDNMITMSFSELKNDMKVKTSVEIFYKKVKEAGIEYKTEFQVIKELYVNKDIALSKIVLNDKSESGRYAIHPALLDGCFQTAISVLLKDGTNDAFIPIGLERISVNSENNIPEEVTCFIEIKSAKNNNSKLHKADIKIFTNDGKPLVNIKNLQLKEVSRQEFAAANDGLKDWFYEIKWEKQTQDSKLSNFIPKLTAIKSNVDSKLQELANKNNLADYKTGIEKLEQISLTYILQALKDLGLNFETNKTYDKNVLAEELKISPRHLKLFYRLFDILDVTGIIKTSGDKFEFTPDTKFSDIYESDSSDLTGKKLSLLLESNPGLDAEVSLLLRCGPKLSEVLKGNVDALQLLFTDSDYSFVTKLYKDSPGFMAMNQSIENLISDVVKNLPSDRKIKILEIGAGTGSTTQSILRLLPKENSEYVFTDISPAFFIKAKEKFKDYSFIEFKVLDIEKNISQQNFEENHYDIVIASNVLHATKDLSITLKNILELLTPGGILVLNEITQKQNWIDLTFGMTDGWWRFDDYDLRKSHPLLNNDEWKKLLMKTGFQAVEISSPSAKDNSWTGQSTIIAGAGADTNLTDSKKKSHLLIFSTGKINKQLSEILNSERQDYTIVKDEKTYDKISDREYKINYSVKDDYLKLFKEIPSNEKVDFKIVYFSDTNKKISGSEKPYEDECINVINIIQSISKSKFKSTPELYLITKEAQHVKAKDPVNGLQSSSLWGMRKVISMELPELKCRIIDFDSESDYNNLIDEINSHSHEDQIAFRSNERFVSRLVRNNSGQSTDFSVNDKSTYLITGGLGGLGILTAKWLADKGAKHLALVGRRDNVKESKEIIDAMRSDGVDVSVYKADVTKKEEVEKVIKEIKKSEYPLKGIVHSVGVLDDGVLMNQSREKFEKVLSPKILGAWYLHELTQKSDLDFFVMYSSVASLLGSAGQSNHSAANAFLDALAHYRRNKNLAALSINWGVWSEIGSAAAKGADKQEKISGIGNINPQQGIRALEKAMTMDTVQIGIFPMDWSKYYERYKQSYVQKLVPKKTDTSGKEKILKNQNGKDDFISRLKTSGEDEHTKLLTEYFQNLISGIMGLEPEDLETELPLNMMGLDSLMAIELKNKVNMELGVDLNLVRYMEETNIIQLAEELKEQLPKILNNGEKDKPIENGKPEISEEEKVRDLLTNLENLSEEEIEKLLNETK